MSVHPPYSLVVEASGLLSCTEPPTAHGQEKVVVAGPALELAGLLQRFNGTRAITGAVEGHAQRVLIHPRFRLEGDGTAGPGDGAADIAPSVVRVGGQQPGRVVKVLGPIRA